MTAEIVVMNKSAVALAADSKVTVGTPSMAKTYDTVNKLFTLSKYHPVGVMVFGNADFMDYPWETIIKIYRQNKGEASEKTIRAWGDDFLKFLRTFGRIRVKHKRDNIKNVADSYLSAILEEIDEEVTSCGHAFGSDEHKQIAKAILIEKINELASSDLFFETLQQQQAFVTKYGKIVDESRDVFFEDFKDDDLTKLADQYVSLCIFAKNSSPMASGVVVAGFGDDEYFPTAICFDTDGYVGDRIKIYEESYCDISREMPGAIRAFAQGEMVQRFMMGADPDLLEVIFHGFGRSQRIL